MDILRRMYTCLSMSLIHVSLCIIFLLPVIVTTMKLENNWKTVPLSEFGDSNSSSDLGKPFYRILNNIDGAVYIGGNETLIKLSIANQSVIIVETQLITTNATDGRVLTCSAQNPNDNEIVCWNFIRLVEKTTNANELLVCGTNAFDRLCYRCDTSNPNNFNCIENGAQLTLVPKRPTTIPSAASFDDLLYAGFSGAGATFQKFLVPSEGEPTRELDTVTTGQQFIKDPPTFVGKPFEYTDNTGNTYVFVFYREVAVEYSNHGDKIYSRIARVCKNETAAGHSDNKLTTFIKARMNCSLPDKLLPFYFDEIHDVIWNNATKEVYAVFTSQENGPKASALCRYRIEDIMKVFDLSEFKGQEGNNVNRLWLPIRPAEDPRPGTCEHIHPTSYAPLLDVPIPNYNPVDPSPLISGSSYITSAIPTLYVEGVHFTTLAIDLDFDTPSCVFFFGTTTGTVVKAHKINCSDPDEEYSSAEITDLGTNGKPITGLQLLSDNLSRFLVVTAENIAICDWPLNAKCTARNEMECLNLRAPYCKWEATACVCNVGVPYCRTVSANPSVIGQPEIEIVESCNNGEVILFCQVDYGPFLPSDQSFNIMWNKTGDPSFIDTNSHLIQTMSFSPVLMQLKVIVLDNKSTGMYTCSTTLGDTTLTRNVTIVSTDCLTINSLQERCNTHTRLQMESTDLKSQYNDQQTCSVDVQSCDTCPYGSAPTP